jgi:hypothetical protein
MFGINTEKWFAVFRKGVEFLAELSIFYREKTSGKHQVSKERQFVTARRKALHSRHILIRKAQTSYKRARCQTTNGHGVTKRLGIVSPKTWAWKPTEKFAEFLANIFFPLRCKSDRKAMAAFAWIKQQEQWRGWPWYDFILQCFRQCQFQEARRPILSKTS